MFLNAKKIAFLGLLLAFTVLLIILSGILETNTLFLLAGASFCVGIAIRECGLKLGFGFYIAGIILSLMLAPNKIYCITFSAMGLYIVLMEFAWNQLGKVTTNNRNKLFWVLKVIIFNTIFIPTLIFMPQIVYSGTLHGGLIALIILVGQIGLFIYDRAYNYVQTSIWSKVKVRFMEKR